MNEKKLAYSEKLKDPRWQKRRLRVFERDGWKCVLCGNKTKTLHVHHARYKSNPWQGSIADLSTLCEMCHEIITEISRLAKFLRPDKTFSVYELKDIVTAATFMAGDDEPWKQRVCAGMMIKNYEVYLEGKNNDL
jgi:hypothetical protein